MKFLVITVSQYGNIWVCTTDGKSEEDVRQRYEKYTMNDTVVLVKPLTDDVHGLVSYGTLLEGIRHSAIRNYQWEQKREQAGMGIEG